jgi:hypothetical protein
MTHGMLAPRDRRVLALGAACMLGLVAAFRIAPAWRTWRGEARAVALERMSQAARTDAVLTAFPETLDTLEARTARLGAMGPALLTGDTPAEAGSVLAGLLAELSRQTLVRLDAIDVHVDSSKTRPLPRVTVDVQATADIVGLTAFLRGLERGPTLLAVRRLEIRPQNVDSPAEQVELLATRFTVEGLALVRTPRDTL